MNAKIEAAIKMLSEQGHTVKSYPHMGQQWYEIVDWSVLVKAQEMEELAESVYTFEELIELFRKRRLEEEGLL